MIWFTIWQLCYLAVRQDILLVSPLATAKRLGELVCLGEFWITVGNSCLHILVGLLLGILTGCVLAVLAGRFHWFEEFIFPMVTIIKSTPIASFIILALIWISSKNLSIFIAFLTTLPMIFTNTLQGIRETDPKLIEMASVYQLSHRKKLHFLYLPQVLPYFYSACITGIGFAWKSGIAAEILAIPKHTIGTELYNAKIYLETEDLFAWTTAVILLSLIFEKVLVGVVKLLRTKLTKFRSESVGND